MITEFSQTCHNNYFTFIGAFVVIAHTSRQRRERDVTTRGSRASQPHGVKIVVAAAREKDFFCGT
jgi:hypothetical protein